MKKFPNRIPSQRCFLFLETGIHFLRVKQQDRLNLLNNLILLRKPLRDLPIETITKNAKAIQNVRYATAAGVPLLTDLITGDQREHMEVCLTALKLDPNIKYDTRHVML